MHAMQDRVEKIPQLGNGGKVYLYNQILTTIGKTSQCNQGTDRLGPLSSVRWRMVVTNN